MSKNLTKSDLLAIINTLTKEREQLKEQIKTIEENATQMTNYILSQEKIDNSMKQLNNKFKEEFNFDNLYNYLLNIGFTSEKVGWLKRNSHIIDTYKVYPNGWTHIMFNSKGSGAVKQMQRALGEMGIKTQLATGTAGSWRLKINA